MTKTIETSEKKTRKCYTMERKIEVVAYAKKNSINKASLKYCLDRKSIRDWIKNEAAFTEMRNKTGGANKKRITTTSRRLKEEELERRVLEWIKNQRSKKLRVSRHLVLREANLILKLLVNDRETESTLKLSKGWLEKFIKRNELSYRKPTSISQKPPSEYASVLVKYFLELGKRLEEHKYEAIFACDETGLWLDAVGGQCLTEKGAREVTVLSTGHEKTRITVMLTARNDGKKLVPFVILPRKRVDLNLEKTFKNKLKLSYGGTNRSWMDDGQCEIYLKNVIGRTLFGKRLLVWDACASHKSEKSQKIMKQLLLDFITIPGGTTGFVQPADVCWNKPFKDKIKKCYEEWFNSDNRTYTKSGNPRAPDPETYLSWIVTAWDGITEELIKKSFKICGIGINQDGSDDDGILCFSTNGSIPEGRKMLQDAREVNELEKSFENLSFNDSDIVDVNDNSIIGYSDRSFDFDQD